MDKHTGYFLLITIAMTLVLSACNISTRNTVPEDNASETPAIPTAIMELTNTHTPEAASTPLPPTETRQPATATSPVEPTSETKLPDLYVSAFTISPSTPIKGQPAHVQIGVYNGGDAEASQFTVLWYGLSTFTSPSCYWNVVDPMNAHSGRLLQCDFVFHSWYPVNKTSLVIVDSTNQVLESNENNNQGLVSPFGVIDH